MKKYGICFMVVCIFLLLAACENAVPKKMEDELNTVFAEEISAEAEYPLQKKELFLTVSSITFSVVGESENIYAGSVPVDQVQWKSADPSVVSVENGILRAVGAGSTEITAEWEDQQLTCAAGCLAENREQLLTLDMDILQQPKRLPPQTDDSCLAYLKNGAMVGDSISYGLLHWEQKSGNLGHPAFLVRGGISIFGLLDRDKLLFWRGEDTLLEDAVQQGEFSSIFVLLGQNDLGYMEIEDTLRNMETLMARVMDKNPNVTIFIQSCFPVKGENPYLNSGNEKLEAFNRRLRPMAEANGYYYLDIAPYIENYINSMSDLYCLDDIHLNEEGCYVWMAALRARLHQMELQDFRIF